MTERWPHLVVALLLLGHLLLLSTQSQARGGRLEEGVLRGLAPVTRGTAGLRDGLAGAFGSFRLVGSLRRENRELQAELATARGELVRLHGIEEELERVASLAAYQRPGTDAFVADIVYTDPSSWLRTLIVYAGSEPPALDQPVVTDRGLVGRVVATAGRYAKVQLVTDRSSAASAMLQRTRRQGLIQGDSAERLLLANVPLGSDVAVGDAVVTAGLDGVFPRGVPIGEVRSVERGPGLFHRIEVEPAVDFGVLEKVYVLREPPLPDAVRERLVASEAIGVLSATPSASGAPSGDAPAEDGSSADGSSGEVPSGEVPSEDAAADGASR